MSAHCNHGHEAKGQIISELLFDVLNFPKNQKFDKFLPKNLKAERAWMAVPQLGRSALKRTPVQDFNYFSIMFNYITLGTEMFGPIGHFA